MMRHISLKKFVIGGGCLCMLLLIFVVLRDEGRTVIRSDTVAPNFSLAPVALLSNCTPHRNVYYLRIHKTGSSTLTTLLYRLAYNHHLSVVPTTEDPFPTGDIPRFLFAVPGETDITHKYNLFAEHSGFNHAAAMQVMPEDTVFVATIRDPFQHLHSLFGEWGHEICKRIGIPRENAMQTFLSRIDTLGPKVETLRPEIKTQNRLARTFGLAFKDFHNQSVIEHLIGQIDKIFTLVVVNEMYDESLIILKRHLCWEMKDVVYTTQRARTYKRADVPPSQQLMNIHKNYSQADYMLYEHYYSALQERIKREHLLDKEVETFRSINKNVSDFCSRTQERLHRDPKTIFQVANNGSQLRLDPSPWGDPFEITEFECALMKLDTWVARSLFKVKQNPHLCNSTKIKRRLTGGSVHMNIKKDSKGYYIIQEAYCTEFHPVYGIPLKVLAHKEAYMFV